jgi:hypothetical protein
MKTLLTVLLALYFWHYREGFFFPTLECTLAVNDIPFYYGIQVEKRLVFKTIYVDKDGRLNPILEWVKL